MGRPDEPALAWHGCEEVGAAERERLTSER